MWFNLLMEKRMNKITNKKRYENKQPEKTADAVSFEKYFPKGSYIEKTSSVHLPRPWYTTLEKTDEFTLIG